jgi:hypothetical protein
MPSVDWRQTPEGLDASKGTTIAGGYTTRSATEQAARIAMGRYPLPRSVRLRLLREEHDGGRRAC